MQHIITHKTLVLSSGESITLTYRFATRQISRQKVIGFSELKISPIKVTFTSTNLKSTKHLQELQLKTSKSSTGKFSKLSFDINLNHIAVLFTFWNYFLQIQVFLRLSAFT